MLMKWLRWILSVIIIILILAFTGLWIAGKRAGHGSFEVSILINRPAPIIFSALTDHEMTKKWVSGIIELKDLTPGNNGVGSKILLTEKINGSIVVMEEEITSLRPPYLKKYNSLGIGTPSKEFIEHGEYELTKQGKQTLFTMRSLIEYKGFLYRLLEPLLTPAVRAKFEGDQKRLKRLLET